MTSLLASTKNQDPIIRFNQWQLTSWEEYLTYRDHLTDQRIKLYYYQNQLFIQMGKEGINHASIGDLFTMIFAFWAAQHPEVILSSFGGALIEQPKQYAFAPDLVVYLGENYPRWQKGETRYINLNKWRVPNLVGEVSDTTISTDLDRKKHLYAELGIGEYWVIDVKAQRIFNFQLQEDQTYQEAESSLILTGLPISLLEEVLVRLEQETNISAANWFARQILSL